MKIKSILLTAILIASLSLMVTSPTVAQDPPAETYQPGFWQPVARVDVKRPVTIKLVNQTDLTLDYGVTEIKIEPKILSPEATATLTKFDLPLYLVIYPASSNPNSSRINLKYKVSVNEDNLVTVDIYQASDDTPGNRTFNLQETGAIYLY
jgi:hypothetical protein